VSCLTGADLDRVPTIRHTDRMLNPAVVSRPRSRCPSWLPGGVGPSTKRHRKVWSDGCSQGYRQTGPGTRNRPRGGETSATIGAGDPVPDRTDCAEGRETDAPRWATGAGSTRASRFDGALPALCSRERAAAGARGQMPRRQAAATPPFGVRLSRADHKNVSLLETRP